MSDLTLTNFAGSVRTSIAGAPRRGYVALVAIWTRRSRSRRHLKHLDAHLLRDIGVTEWNAQREAERPFWD
ncbi:protein of unknown function [Monaibacterium marinum]|uniref:YjiS-like domain-containing protein n=1 Tax=Pontivivens marinum TaxID=1690039 RepID=A0A2C9CPK2_9RHOB|nr:DUF1127 domain-containing protein [Monaibacterium marinum]SOH93441.1 protein of unknown function [Monaibacterium marinum]